MQTVQRFAGTVKALGPVDIAAVAQWVTAIPFAEWHQQAPTATCPIRPAMMTDLAWHGFGEKTDAPVAELLAWFPGCSAYQRMLSVVMPGDTIPPHCDSQADYWLARVHVPLTGDDKAHFIVGGESHRLVPGTAYLVNTLAEHCVINAGAAPRIHFMFDVAAR